MIKTNGNKKEEIQENEEDADLSFLLNSSYPLMVLMRDNCTGTHKHEQMVAAMIERPSIVLGLNVTKMKIAAQYHDIGKINHPSFYSENQPIDSNLHDDLDPWVSSQIITRHVSDSVTILLNDENFPRSIIKIISQHHGTEVTDFFKIIKPDDTRGYTEDDFRYKSTRPDSIESALLMICDKLEAMSRSKQKEDPCEMVNQVISNLIDNTDQLDDVVITPGQFKKLKQALITEMESIYQKRVAYTGDQP